MRDAIKQENGIAYLLAQLQVSMETVVAFSLRALANLCSDGSNSLVF
jgi:hypothetical protein